MNDQAITAYIAVGANLGDRRGTIEQAIRLLDADQNIEVLRVSTLSENPAVGGPANSPDFLNGVVAVRTTLPAAALLDRLLAIEQSLGRERRQRWAPRTIDLDLLLYGNESIRDKSLTVPHERLCERRFVLQPLTEIAPDVRIPTTGQTARECLAKLDRDSPQSRR